MDRAEEIALNVKRATEIFKEHANTIRSAIKFYINDQSSVDDIFQEFFLSLVRNPIPQRNQNIRSFINWAIKNDVLDAASRERSHRIRNQKYAEMHRDRFKSKTPDEVISHAEEIHQLFSIIEKQLLHHEIEVLVQKYRYGRGAGEMAQAMGINRRSVSCYLCTGLKKLRKFVCPIRENATNVTTK